MTKRHADTLAVIPNQEALDPWRARGYRPDLALSRKSPSEDPKGEIAYQRAFAEAAKKKPTRFPDPSFYPNSPSAQECIKRRDEAIFSRKKRDDPREPSRQQPTTPTSIYTRTGGQDRFPSPRHRDEPQYPPRSTSTLDAQVGPTTHHRSGHQFSPTAARPPEQHPYPLGPPMTLEPKLTAPSGPDRMLR